MHPLVPFCLHQTMVIHLLKPGVSSNGFMFTFLEGSFNEREKDHRGIKKMFAFLPCFFFPGLDRMILVSSKRQQSLFLCLLEM